MITSCSSLFRYSSTSRLFAFSSFECIVSRTSSFSPNSTSLSLRLSFSWICLARSSPCCCRRSLISVTVDWKRVESSLRFSASSSAARLLSSWMILFCFCSSRHNASSFSLTVLTRASSLCARSFSRVASSALRCIAKASFVEAFASKLCASSKAIAVDFSSLLFASSFKMARISCLSTFEAFVLPFPFPCAELTSSSNILSPNKLSSWALRAISL
mmetsp:Transcript_17055/g.28767  ORF Transcript_17055/g.28767 Transcript_17055/m.28767 type:complete len:216 (+) Transcript_17055:840-1487(+)